MSIHLIRQHGPTNAPVLPAMADIPGGRHVYVVSLGDSGYDVNTSLVAPGSNYVNNLSAINTGSVFHYGPAVNMRADIALIDRTAVTAGQFFQTPTNTLINWGVEFAGCTLDWLNIYSASAHAESYNGLYAKTVNVSTGGESITFKSVLLVAAVAIARYTTDPAISFTPAAGWTELANTSYTAGGEERQLRTYYRIVNGTVPGTNYDFTGTLNSSDYNWLAMLWVITPEPFGGVANLITREGSYLRAYCDYNDNLYLSRQASLYPNSLATQQLTSANSDIYPWLYQEPDRGPLPGRIWLLWTRNAVDLYECYSDNDGITWSTPALYRAWLRHGRAVIHPATGVTLRAGADLTQSAVDPISGFTGARVRGTKRYPGDTAEGDQFQLSTFVMPRRSEPFAMAPELAYGAPVQLVRHEYAYSVLAYGRARNYRGYDDGEGWN